MTTDQQQPGAEVALPSDEPRPPTLRDLVRKMEPEFALAAPKGVEARQIVRDAETAISQNPDLLKCEPRSVLGGLMTMAQLGLRVGVLGHGWLIPFKERAKVGGRWDDIYRAQLVIGYQGMIALAYRSGLVDRITARTVRAADHFDLEYGLNERLVHVPAPGERGEPVGYYATVKIRGAGEPMFFHMTHAEMLLYRDRYAMAKKWDRDTNTKVIVGPWRDEFESMALKTCIRQLSKFIPKGTDLAAAMAVDDTVRVDVSPHADILHVSHHIERGAADDTVHVDLDDVPVDEPPAGDS
jgi:recombination protein RecT